MAEATVSEARIFVLASFFFDVSETGYDSRLGVFVHEMTHFHLAGAAKDRAYGTDEARTLAVANPAWAQSNADNYEFFIESVFFSLAPPS
jgi:hypothetical protein